MLNSSRPSRLGKRLSAKAESRSRSRGKRATYRSGSMLHLGGIDLVRRLSQPPSRYILGIYATRSGHFTKGFPSTHTLPSRSTPQVHPVVMHSRELSKSSASWMTGYSPILPTLVRPSCQCLDRFRTLLLTSTVHDNSQSYNL